MYICFICADKHIMKEKLDKEVLASLIPQGCRVNWDQRTLRYYVFKSTYVYDPKIKRGREIRTQVGTVVDGKFSYAKSFLLKQKIQSLENRIASDHQKKTVQAVCDASKEEITDSRQAGKIIYPLAYVYLVALLSSLSGQTNCVQIADYWKNNRVALESIFEDFPHQDISYDTVRRLLMLIDPHEFQGFYSRLVSPLLHQFCSRVVAVDGQAIKAPKNSKMRGGRYILSFYDTENGVVLSQKLINEKENEITYASPMIEGLDLRATVVTADALNTQEKFARTLVEHGADYCLAVKENHRGLYLDMRLAFMDKLEARTLTLDKTELGHGRVESRVLQILPGSVLDKAHWKKWVGLQEGTIVKVTLTTEVKKNGEKSTMDRYFISSLRWDNRFIAEQCARAVRQHWNVENNLHYVLDVDFNQDRTQCKNANYLQNRVLLNKLSLAAIRRCQSLEEKETGKTAMNVKRYMSKFANLSHALQVLPLMFNE